MLLLLGLLALAAACPLVAVATAPRDRRRSSADLFTELGITPPPGSANDRNAKAISRLSSVGRRVTPESKVDQLSHLVARSGTGWSVEVVLAMKTGAALAGLALGLWVALSKPTTGLGLAIVLGAAGWFGPDSHLERKARARSELLRRALPDALDLLAISVEAGVSFEGAMAAAASDLGGPLGEEFDRLLQEMRLGLSRREALISLKDRNDTRELSGFILALLQADALGISVGAVLRTQAGEMRSVRRRLAREQAAKTPVKLLFPLMFGIFPALLIVIMGPAVIRIMTTIGTN